MKLYHYTGTDHVAGIRAEGIVKGGGIPLLVVERDGRPGFRYARGWVWLTASDDWAGQSWAADIFATDCDRTAVRFNVAIPKASRRFLVPSDELIEAMSKQLAGVTFTNGATLAPNWREPFTWAGHESWRVLRGRVPAGWLRELEERPPEVQAYSRLGLAHSHTPRADRFVELERIAR